MIVVAFVSFSLFNFVGDPVNSMTGEMLQMKDVLRLEKYWV
jgi:hypothetical protein